MNTFFDFKASSATRKVMRATQAYPLPYNDLEVEVFYVQRVLLNEFAAWLDNVTH